MKKLISTIAIILCFCVVGVIGASASDVTYHYNTSFQFDWIKSDYNGFFRNAYVVGTWFHSCGAQTEVSLANDETGYAFVYCRGLNYSVGNWKEASGSADDGNYLSSPNCYANGSTAQYTNHKGKRFEVKTDGWIIACPSVRKQGRNSHENSVVIGFPAGAVF